MAKQLTRCLLKSTFLVTNRLYVNRQLMPIIKYSNIAVTKTLPQINKLNVDYDEPKDFKKFVDESKSGANIAISTLIKILSVSRATAKKIVEEHSAFKTLAKKTIYRNFQILRESGVYKSTIKDNTFLLTDSTEELRKKIEIIKHVDPDINNSVALFPLSLTFLVKFKRHLMTDVNFLPAPNRIQYLAKRLNASVDKVCRSVSYYPFVLYQNPTLLFCITEYFLGSGIEPEFILNDLQAYMYRLDRIKEKIKHAKEVGVLPLKPWILRCSDALWRRMEERHNGLQTVEKPNREIHEHLCEIFQCDMELAKYAVERHPQFRTVNICKLTTMAKLIYKEGYTIHDVIRAPRIFCRRIDTVKELIKVWKESGSPRPALFTFQYHEKSFKKFLQPPISSDVANKIEPES